MRSPEEIDRLKACYEEMIYYNDYHLGLLVERLKDLNLYDDAFLILTGDHGKHLVNAGTTVTVDRPLTSRYGYAHYEISAR